MGMRRNVLKRRTERDVGFDVAMGDIEPETVARRPRPSGRVCPHCGDMGRVDIVDTARIRAYLTCRSCGHEWETSRFAVMPLPIPR